MLVKQLPPTRGILVMDNQELLYEQHPVEALVLEILHKKFNLASLYPYQELVIRTILERGGLFDEDQRETAPEHQIVVLPTGSGKSVCFMLPALLLPGITVVIYPLLSLMNDQGRRMDKLGAKAVFLRGAQSLQEREQVWLELASGGSRFVITNPETLRNDTVLAKLSTYPISLLVIDEVHTVTQWGDTFRPSYLELPRIIESLKPEQLTAFTATASPRIIQRVTEILFNGKAAHIVKGDPDRPNITYRALPTLCKIHDLEMLVRRSLPRPIVVFCSTRKRCEQTAWELTLRLHDTDIRYYHAGLEKGERQATERWFLGNEDAILCATCAYGMGVDKSDIRSVIHLDLSPDVESFLQESGRAGRDGQPAFSVVLIGQEEHFRLSQVGPDSRFGQLFTAFSAENTCRREAMLQLLGFPNDSCSGCDVCSHTQVLTPEGEQEILGLFGRQSMRYTVTEAAYLLAGSPLDWRCPPAFRYDNWYGTLNDWSPQDLLSAIALLQRKEILIALRRGPLKNKPVVTSTFCGRILRAWSR
jgi:ATP-dependent DNA helicase RecQ